MQPIFYYRHQFRSEVIQSAVWLYLRFTLSYRDVEELLAAHGPDVSNDPALGTQVRPRVRPQPAAAAALSNRHLTPG
jgi:hypothetical protein